MKSLSIRESARRQSRPRTIGGAFALRGSPGVTCALEELYRTHRAPLLRYLRRHAGCEDFEDCLQEVFVRAAANARLYELHNPGGYLCRIAKSVLIDRARRRARQIRCIPIGCANEPDGAPCQENGLLEQDLRKKIDGVLATLPSRTQIVFSLSRFGGLSYRQIHEQLGMSEAAVEYHMMKALACLRQALGRD